MTASDALVVVGLGLASPVGRTPREHAFFVRAGESALSLGAFEDVAKTRLRIAHAPWLGAGLGDEDRLVALGEVALAAAREPLGSTPASARAPVLLHVVTAPPSPSLTDAELERTARRIAEGSSSVLAGRHQGAAAFFHALSEAGAAVRGGKAWAAGVLAVDSSATLGAAGRLLSRPTSPWARLAPVWSEAAAAVVVTTAQTAAARGLATMGTLHGHATRRGSSSDEDDEVVDGEAMTELLASLPAPGPIGQAFGPYSVDSLRHLEWVYAASRQYRRFHPECLLTCVEEPLGLVGAAAGGVHLAYALATRMHGTLPQGAEGPLVAWAISSDGTRGVCSATGGAGHG